MSHKVEKTLSNKQEQLTFRSAAISGVLGGLFGLAIYLPHQGVPISGRHSIGIVVTVASTLLALVLFAAYTNQEIAQKQIVRKRWTRYGNVLIISLAFAIIALVTALVMSFTAAGAFKGLTFDHWTAAAITAALVAAIAYVLMTLAQNFSITYGVYALLFVMGGGMTASMVTNQTTDWWRANISNLGTDISTHQTLFNLTLILSGFLILALTSGVFGLHRDWYQQHSKVGPKKYQTTYTLVMLMGLFLSGVGLFHYEAGTILVPLHNASAGLLGVCGVILMVGARWLLPVFEREFYIYSWVTAAAMALFFVLTTKGVFFTLTGMEVVDFIIGGAWLIVFLRHVLRRPEYGIYAKTIDL